MILFFAIIVAFGIWSSNDTGPHHQTYTDDKSWYEKELHTKLEPHLKDEDDYVR